MKLTLCRSIMILIILACILAVTCAMSYQMGIHDSKEFKCVKQGHNTMCEEVKK